VIPRRVIFVLLIVSALPMALAAATQGDGPAAPDSAVPVDITLLPAESREAARSLIVQDYMGRMKPIDTLARALVRKITKRFDLDGQDPVDTYLSWLANPDYWWDQPLLYVRHAGLKQMLDLPPETTHVPASRFVDPQGNYALMSLVDAALRTPDRERTKAQRKLIAFDERLNLLHLAIRGHSLQVFPIPGDANDSWANADEVLPLLPSDRKLRYWRAWDDFRAGLNAGQPERFAAGVEKISGLQREFGSAVLPSPSALKAELLLNRARPFARLVWSYLAAGMVLICAFFVAVSGRADHRVFRILHRLGILALGLSLAAHLTAFVLRWLASGRAPLSNGYESLLFIGFSVGLAGLLFEIQDRRGASGGTAALLAFLILGISMMSHFDPAIGLLVPILHSYWLNIHVTVITASYGFLGLGALVGALILLLYLGKSPERQSLRASIADLADVLFNLNLTGLGLLTIGTLLGGIWANESWGRYWGWDPKESWSLITILFYTVASHTRLIPALKRPWVLAALSFAGISTVIMTFFGVNYYLIGLHSYARGGVSQVPVWVYVLAGAMLGLILISGAVVRGRRWDRSPDSGTHPQEQA
jgi:cytochrome c-type biogenesis protein CcsB